MRGAVALSAVFAALWMAPTLNESVSAQTTQASMDVGSVETVSLSLGIARDRALARVSRAGYKTVDIPSGGRCETVALTRREPSNDIERSMLEGINDGTLSFQAGTL